jgi:WD40 repeat protein
MRCCHCDIDHTLFAILALGIFYSSSYDHSLKRWDLEHQDCVWTCNAAKVFTSIDIQPSSAGDMLLSSHPDGKIRLWDARSGSGGEGAQCQGAWGAENDRQWIAQTRWHPSNEHVFAACDYAGMLRIYDRRAATALAAIDHHEGKALCLAWMTPQHQQRVLTGGSDGYLRALSLA